VASAIATIIATVGGAGLVLALIWVARSGSGEREDEEAARDFFSRHGHWPDEPPEAAALHRGEVPYARVDRPPAGGPTVVVSDE
jgi:hypothetical protein